MSEWKECVVGDYAEVQNGFAFKSHDFKISGKMSVIKIKNVASGKLSMKEVQYFDGSCNDKKAYVIEKDDILIAMTGSHVHQPSSMVGKVVKYDLDYPSLLNQRVGKIYSMDIQQLDNNFLYYLYKQPDVTYELALNAGGSANQANISSTLIKSLDILLPSLPEQKAIASFLSSLDDKIDLLHRQNKTLEAMAETLFRQWFVEEADESWETGKLPDEFEFIMGASPPGDSYNENEIGIPMYQGNADFTFRFPKRRVYTTEPKRLAEKYDTLISVRAPVGEQNMAEERCCIGRGVAAFRFKHDKRFYTYTYFKLKSIMNEIRQFNETGTVFGSISKGDFMELDIGLPPLPTIKLFQTEVKPIDDKIILNCNQIVSLEKLRDTILPKLMNGEVRCTELDEVRVKL